MADQEIAQHSKNIIDLVTKKHHPLAHRIREIAIEVLTIVFAVSMSIWLHGLSEHYHQQKEVRSFLIGLRGDLKEDIAQLKDTQESYHQFDKNFTYLSSLEPGKTPDWKAFEQAYDRMDSNWFFIPNTSRFNGFQTSGKLSNIDNEGLLNAILALYQSVLPQIRSSEGGWGDSQQKLRNYRDDSLTSDDPADHYRVLTTPKGRRLLKKMVANPQLYERYQSYIAESEKIIKQIDAEYPEAAGAKAH